MSVAPRLRDRLKETTEQAILAAAETVFAESGLHAARMETIAKDAGVSVGTLYNYFKDRDSLLHALIDARAEQLVEEMRTAIASLENAPVAVQLRHFVLTLFRYIAENGRFMRILQQGESEPVGCIDMRRPSELAILTAQRMRQLAKELMAKAIERGELRSDLPELPTLLVSMCKGTAIWHEREHGSLDLAKLADKADGLVEFFMRGAEPRVRDLPETGKSPKPKTSRR